MYQYASYLQSNQLASDLSYEPYPFVATEEKIMEQMKSINKTIIQNTHIMPEDKNMMMRDFIVNTIDKFKKKVLIQLDRIHNWKS